jgi:hypothetical protein
LPHIWSFLSKRTEGGACLFIKTLALRSFQVSHEAIMVSVISEVSLIITFSLTLSILDQISFSNYALW